MPFNFEEADQLGVDGDSQLCDHTFANLPVVHGLILGGKDTERLRSDSASPFWHSNNTSAKDSSQEMQAVDNTITIFAVHSLF